MKNKFKKAFISGAIMATGLAVGYAASTAFQDLGAIKENFNYILNLNTSKQEEIDGLKTSKQKEIDALNTTIEDLKAQIVEQTQNNSDNQADIDDLNSTIADLQAQIVELEQTQNNSGKQEQIKELEKQVKDLKAQIVEQTQNNSKIENLEKQVEVLEAERDGLITQRDKAIDDKTELEGKIKDLRDYTDQFVNVDVEG